MADKKRKKKTSLFDGSERITRREFLKRVMGVIPMLVIPPLILEQLSCSDSQKYKIRKGISFELTFSKQMNRQSVINNLLILPAPDSSPAFTWKENDSVLFAESFTEEKGTLYTVTIGAGASDTNGIALDGNGDGIAGDPYVFTLKSAEYIGGV